MDDPRFRQLHGLAAGTLAWQRGNRLEPGLTETDLAGSAVACTARILLQRAAQAGGLKLTATGNLSRAVVAETIEVVEWPDFDKATLFELNKVINEPDFLPSISSACSSSKPSC